MDAKSLQIRALCVTSNSVSDASVLSDLCLKRKNSRALLVTAPTIRSLPAKRSAGVEQFIIRPRKNARIRRGLVFEHRNAAVAACRRLGRSIWKRWTGHHRRSWVETKMNGIKKLGERVMPRTFERQLNEMHIRAAILHRFTELGLPQTAAAA